MDTQLFIETVTKMREYQCQYFEAARKGMPGTAKMVLPHAKAYEAKVDAMIKEMKGENVNSQSELF
jgi:t-SNARE complex subunit (syntaxin)